METEKVVCVTGASGYIASWIVNLLLQRGYTVKASVRDPNDVKKIGHLISLEGAEERLHLVKADLLEEGSFDALVDGCEGVFHTASPVLFTVSDPQPQLIDPAVKGTLNVLRSCAKTPSVKRVILTSSTAAVYFNRRALSSDVIIDETWFSDPAFCEESKSWYELSKTLAEEAAWKFARENGIDLITMNPTYVIGPMLQPDLNASVEMILNLLNGAERTCPNKPYPTVDVRDVALAHILGFEAPSANGRYCLVENCVHYSQIMNILRQLYPALHIPDKCEDDEPFVEVFQVSKDKANSLGISFTPVEASLQDTVESLKVNGAKRTFPNMSYRYVDVRDVALAHVLALETPAASRRYCLVNNVVHCSQTVNVLRQLYPALSIPDKCEDDEPYAEVYEVSKEKAASLGISYTSFEDSLRDTVKNFKEKGFLKV